MPKRLLFLGACAAVIIAALTAYALVLREHERAPSATSSKSGLRGIVILYGCSSADNDSCLSKPIAATQIVRREPDETRVKEFRSESDGSFRVALRPGRYIIEDGSHQNLGGYLSPIYGVVVPKSGFRYMRIVYDTPRA